MLDRCKFYLNDATEVMARLLAREEVQCQVVKKNCHLITVEDKGVTYRCNETTGKIFIDANFSRFHFGHNLHVVSHREICEVVRSIQDFLGVSGTDVKMRYLEIGAVVELSKDISYYTSGLGTKAGFYRNKKYKDLYYENTLTSIALYDKVAKIKKDNPELYEKCEDLNLLRIEIKQKSRPTIRDKMSEGNYDHCLLDLLDRRYLELWGSYFLNSIASINGSNIGIARKVRVVSDINKTLLSRYLKTPDGILARDAIIEQCKINNVFKSGSEISRAKKVLNSISVEYASDSSRGDYREFIEKLFCASAAILWPEMSLVSPLTA